MERTAGVEGREFRWGRLAPWLAGIGIALTVPLSIAILVGVLPNDGGFLAVLVILAVVAWGGTGWLLGARRPENPIGLLMAAEAFMICYASVQSELYLWRPNWPLSQALQDTQGFLVPMLLAVPAVLLLFPTGRPPTRRWNIVLWLMVVSIATGLVGMGLAPEDPIPWSSLASHLTQAAGVTGLLAAALSIAAVIVRFRRSRGDEREQMRWLALVAIFGGAFFVATLAANVVAGDDQDNIANAIFFNLLVLTMTVGLPAAIGRAVLRYRLYDIDVVIKKTVLYGVVALVFFGIFALATLTVSGLVGLTGVLDSDAGSTLAAVTIGILAWPAVLIARRIADRIVYGGRATPYEILTGFTGRIGDTYATDDVLQRMAQVLAEGTGASSASVQLRVGAELRELASFGTRTGDESVKPVRLHGDEVGALTVTMPPNDPINPAKERLIADLATQAGPVLRNVQLIEELRASRQRLVAAQDEERRKLERNIHDGVQQQLVALAVRLKLADTMIDRDSAKAHEALAALQTDAGTALDDLRNLARGIYPPLLADRGLPAALEAQARKAAVPTTVDAEGIGRYDQAVEAAVYFCTLEALNNVAKYAYASRAVVRLAQDDGVLRFEVRDDGTGFDVAAVRTGTGLQGMTDRLDAIGGELHIESKPSAGTLVGGSVPATAT